MSEHLNVAVNNEKKSALLIDEKDNVSVALTQINEGENCLVRKGKEEEIIRVLERINFGHKIALTDLEKDAPVLKYGEIIGRMSVPVQKGSWIHNHNMYCERGMRA
ncbi:UxaA family hydrolase [Salsuginibacillus kocurii]|uniref:UxaA family hydrolase n=1 Tax=Salsuginibacillus kocurii TaxID=427078 RepID=UPI000371CFBB|nr:UxaA family hydrolase [Salsuginibacillus kocurii]